LRTFDHDHTHVTLPRNGTCCFLQQSTGRLDCASCRCGYVGGIAHLCLCLIEHRGSMLVAGLIPTGRIPPERTLDVNWAPLFSSLCGVPWRSDL
jgi:hypothetical protein